MNYVKVVYEVVIGVFCGYSMKIEGSLKYRTTCLTHN